MTRTYLQSCQYESLTNIRRWQINHFCFNGHCITGRNLSGAIITIFLISLANILWLIFELPFFMKEFNSTSLIILITGLLLNFYIYIYFFRSMCTDSGIIQRPSSNEHLILNKELNLNRMTSDYLNNLIFNIQVNDILVKCKYCITCHMIRPLRSSHCAICSNCISIFDHHCPFLSTCALYTCNLLGYHTMISSRSLTTRQDDKRIYINKNPFNTHPWFFKFS